MIKNERQYRITKAEAEKFQGSLERWDPSPPDGIDPAIHAAQKSALESQLRDLKWDVAEYEALRSGRHHVLEVNSFEDFPDALVRARIAAGLSQKDLGERLGLKEQQIQKYEATGYSGASLARMTEVVNALGLRIRKEVFLPAKPDAPDALLRGLADIGFDRKFIERRLVTKLDPGTAGKRAAGDDGFVFHAATRAGRILGVSPAALLDPAADREPPLGSDQVQGAGRGERAAAHRVHLLRSLRRPAPVRGDRPPAHEADPNRPEAVRAAIVGRYGEHGL